MITPFCYVCDDSFKHFQNRGAPDSPEEMNELSDDDSSTTSTLDNPFDDIDFTLELDPTTGEYVCIVDVTGLGIPEMEITVDTPEELLSMDVDPETLLETFLEWEIPLILEALMDQN